MAIENKQSFKFTYSERLHKDREFSKILKSGRRVSHPAIFVYAYKREKPPDFCRLGLITSGKIAIAARRNRVKRRLREIFRTHKHLFNERFDIIFMPKRNAVNMRFSELKEIVLSLLKKAGVLK